MEIFYQGKHKFFSLQSHTQMCVGAGKTSSFDGQFFRVSDRAFGRNDNYRHYDSKPEENITDTCQIIMALTAFCRHGWCQ